MMIEETLVTTEPAELSRRGGIALPAVRVCGLLKRYKDGTEANRGIDLELHPGELVSILGPNGAGKTTFLRQLTTELHPTSGSIEVFGIDAVASPQSAKRMMGITPQDASVFESLTVLEHLELFGRLKGLRKEVARREAIELIESLGLTAETKKRLGLLSGGQRRRVLVGIALLGRPPLLLLDEPTTGLDPSSRMVVWGVIRRAVTDGSAVILSTHYIEEAERLSDRVGIISRGRLIACGSLDELLGCLERSYRLNYRDSLDPFGKPCRRYFASFGEAKQAVTSEQPSEFSITRATLEDVYFTLTGQRFADRDENYETLV